MLFEGIISARGVYNIAGDNESPGGSYPWVELSDPFTGDRVRATLGPDANVADFDSVALFTERVSVDIALRTNSDNQVKVRALGIVS